MADFGVGLFVAVCFRRNWMTTPFDQPGRVLIFVFLRVKSLLQITYASPINILLEFEALPSEDRSNRGSRVSPRA